MSNITPGFTIASHCLDKIEATHAGERSRAWIDLDGDKLSDSQMISLTGLSLLALNVLWVRNGGDCYKIINRKKLNNTNMGFSIAVERTDKINHIKFGERSREWVDLDGNAITDKEMLDLAGIVGRNSLLALLAEYDGDCEKIIKRPKIGEKQNKYRVTKYRDKKGNFTTLDRLHKSTGVRKEKITNAFHVANFDYKKAHIEINKLTETKVINGVYKHLRGY